MKYFAVLSRFFSAVFKHRRVAILSDSNVKYLNLSTKFQLFLAFGMFLVGIYLALDYFLYKKAAIEIKDKQEEVQEVREINENLTEEVKKIATQIDEISQTISGKNVSSELTELDLHDADGLIDARNIINKSLANLDSAIQKERDSLYAILSNVGLAKIHKDHQSFQSISRFGFDKLQFKHVSFASDVIDSNLNMILKKANDVKNMKKLIAILPLGKPVKNARITSHFGMRRHPKLFVSMFHNGIDFAGQTAAQVFSTGSGRVKISEYSPSFGNYIVISHGRGIETLYAHLQKRLVNPGESVKRDQLIGFQGSTGRSTGQHVHYEVHFNGIPKNPMPFLNRYNTHYH